MSLLPMAIVDALAGKISRTITPALQLALKELTDHAPAAKPLGSFFQRMTNPQSGGGSSSERGSSSPSPAKLPSASGGGSSSERGSSSPSPAKLPSAISRAVNTPQQQEKPQRPEKPKPFSREAISKLVVEAEKRSEVDQQKSGQSFWQRGWGALQNGQKRSASSRAARLTTIAAKRLASAKRAVRVSNQNRDQPGWHPAKHGNLLANKNSAAQKLAQATALQARSTIMGALSSGRVASGLVNLASKIPMLASRLAVPAAVAYAAIKAPFAIAKMNDNRIESLRDSARYNSRIQSALASYDVKTHNIAALNARDTAPSTEFLVNQQNKLRDTLRPFQAAMSDAANYTQGGLAWVATKFFEGHQLQFDLAAAAKKTAEDALQGNPTDPIKNFNKIRADRDKKRAEDEKIQSQQFSDIFGALAKGALSDQQMNLDNARFNNVTVQPLRPIL
jgi:hypothetical protein